MLGFASCALTPYEATLQCPLSSDFGHCTDVGGAYDAAMAGATSPAASPPAPGDVSPRAPRNRRVSTPDDVLAVGQQTRDAQLAAVTEAPRRRSLVVTSLGADRTLFIPRYMFYLASEKRLRARRGAERADRACAIGPTFPGSAAVLALLLAEEEQGATWAGLADLRRREPFSRDLPYLAFDATTAEYNNAGNSIGLLWECRPFPLLSDAGADTLAGLLRQSYPRGDGAAVHPVSR